MDSFTFSLNKVYELRIREEKEVKRHFGEIQRLVLKKEQEIQQMMSEKDALMNEQQVSIEQMQVHFRYIARLDQQIMEEHQLFLSIKQQLSEVLELYVRAQKERKSIEKLHDKRLFDYKEELKREEQKQLDEFRQRSLF